MSDKAKLKINDSQIDLNLIKGSENEIGIDISSLRSKSNVITLDPGYKNTGSCQSSITFLDGEWQQDYSLNSCIKNGSYQKRIHFHSVSHDCKLSVYKPIKGSPFSDFSRKRRGDPFIANFHFFLKNS